MFQYLLIASLVLGSVSASGKCFSTKVGKGIEGGDYKRIKDIHSRSCAAECRDDVSCLAYEWNGDSRTCFLKSRSISGQFVNKQSSVVGFCLDDDDEFRYRMHDHSISGQIIAEADHVPDGDDCKLLCTNMRATFYSWKPMENNRADVKFELEHRMGYCTCLETMTEVKLEFESFSGFIAPSRKRTRHVILH